MCIARLQPEAEVSTKTPPANFPPGFLSSHYINFLSVSISSVLEQARYTAVNAPSKQAARCCFDLFLCSLEKLTDVPLPKLVVHRLFSFLFFSGEMPPLPTPSAARIAQLVASPEHLPVLSDAVAYKGWRNGKRSSGYHSMLLRPQN